MRHDDIERPSTCKMLQKKIGVAMMWFSTALLLLVCYMAWYPVKVIDLKSVELVNEKGEVLDEVQEGQTLTYRLTFRKYVNVPSEIHVQIVNKYITSYPVHYANLGVTSEEKIRRNEWDIAYVRIPFPKVIGTGKHYLNLNMSYKLNIFRTETYSVRSKWFNVKVGRNVHIYDVPMIIEKK